jgi:hypothetical protein
MAAADPQFLRLGGLNTQARLVEAVGAQFPAGGDRPLFGAIARVVVGGLVGDL